MNVKVLFLLVVICGMIGRARSQEVFYSPSEKFDFRTGDFSVVGKSGNRLYTYRGSAEGFYLDAFNEKMERQATVILDFFPKKIYETRFVSYPDKLIVLYQSIERNMVVQYAALLDQAGMLKVGPLALDSVKTGFFGPNREYFSSSVSEDKQHIIVYSSVIKGSTLTFNGRWLTSGLDVEKTVSTSFHADNEIANGEGIAANDGSFHLPVYTPVGSRNFADQLWLLSVPVENTNEFQVNELPLNGKFAAGTYMKMDNSKSRIYVGGFYSEKRNGNYEGVLYTYYDLASRTFQNRKDIVFDERLRNATGERNTKKAFNDFFVKNIIVKNDGGFVFIAEDYFVTTRNGGGPGYGYYSWYYPSLSASIREYHYQDILVTSYNSEGVREWHTFIRKDQYSQEDGGIFSSFNLVNSGGMLGFLFNDFNSSRSRIQLATIDPTGKATMRSLAAGKSDDPDWLPRSGKQIAARETVVPCLRRKQICFAKVVF
ncbi:hypothetical protein [Polluticoccus soli]|uniref:hypothetical protein n=1 Tax=Polluticoccus soli TaxID=3034150 RepID=UPI0023E2DC85|nr:hypothetical protein [Flavipsychrobacter sp. JY13-12]